MKFNTRHSHWWHHQRFAQLLAFILGHLDIACTCQLNCIREMLQAPAAPARHGQDLMPNSWTGLGENAAKMHQRQASTVIVLNSDTHYPGSQVTRYESSGLAHHKTREVEQPKV